MKKTGQRKVTLGAIYIVLDSGRTITKKTISFIPILSCLIPTEYIAHLHSSPKVYVCLIPKHYPLTMLIICVPIYK